MSLVSWAKKELSRLKFQRPKRLLPPQTVTKTSTNCIMPAEVSEVVLAADLKCIKCQERVAAIVSAINNDLDSIVVHVVEKKVTLTRKAISH